MMKFPLHVESYMVDATGHLSMAFLGHIALSSASKHANSKGFGRQTIDGHTYSWVLSRLVIEVEYMPSQFEDFTLLTWVESIYHSFSGRCFKFLDKEGKTFGHAHSVWAVIDLQSRQMVDLDSFFSQKMNECLLTDETFPIEKNSRVRIHSTMQTREYLPQFSDIDFNYHVNSMRSIEHILDLFPLQYHYQHPIHRLEISYKGEIQYNTLLHFFKEELSPNDYGIEVRKDDETVLIQSRVIFF